MSNYIIAFVSALLLLSTSAVADTDETTSGTSSWQNRCEEMKKNHLTNDSLQVTFSEKPEIHSDLHPWSLFWNGIDVPLPQVVFQDVYVKRGYQNHNEVMMIAKDGLAVNVMVFENKPSDDMMAGSPAENNHRAGKRESKTAANKDGRPPRASDTILLGYRITPRDLTCLEKNRTEETAYVDALIMKGIARPGELIAVYKDAGAYRGWIEKERSARHITYVINILPESNNDIWNQINYRMPANAGYDGLPFLIGHQRQKPTSPSPDWLSALNAAMISRSKDSWKRYAALARKAGLSEKSITSVMKIQNVEIEP